MSLILNIKWQAGVTFTDLPVDVTRHRYEISPRCDCIADRFDTAGLAVEFAVITVSPV